MPQNEQYTVPALFEEKEKKQIKHCGSEIKRGIWSQIMIQNPGSTCCAF